jgi:tRNA modification GTPase
LLFRFGAAAGFATMNLDDTIVAISTPAGRGGIGVVRLSGPESKAVAARMLRLAAGRSLEPGRAHFGELVEIDSGERIDEVVATFFAKPHSYTTDDIVEISCHGSPVVLRRVVEMAMAQGARLAEPGEFTQRAFLNGRLDLTQAEAVRDLIDAQTIYQAKVAARQLKGSLSHALAPVKDKLVGLIARMEAGIDFAEDDVAVMPPEQALAAMQEIGAALRKLEASFTFGKVVHEGLTLAIVGRPNVGKSSLLNRLVERERAIVTAAPGTTRDLVSETVALGGIPVRMVDTAGIREALRHDEEDREAAGQTLHPSTPKAGALGTPLDEAEIIGIRRSMEALADADLVLVVLDSAEGVSEVDRELLSDVSERAAIAVYNKADLDKNAGGTRSRLDAASKLPSVRTSALTGEGIAELREEILRMVRGGAAEESGAMLTNLRQQGQVQASLAALSAAAESARHAIPAEMVLLDLYNALRALDELTGATTADDVLNLIFSTFCIGK